LHDRPPSGSLENDEGGGHYDAQANLRAFLEDQKRRDEQRDRELQELRIENARLQGRLQGPQGVSPDRFAFETQREYELGYAALEAQARASEDEADRQSLLRQRDAIRADFQRFEAHRRTEQEASHKRQVERAAFLATRRIDPASEVGRFVDLLHERGIPFERIEQILIEPHAQLARMRAEQGADVRNRQLSSSVAIEPGLQRQNPPQSVTARPRTPDLHASDDLVRRYNNKHLDFESQLFDSLE
jgi:hypothetical protein